MGMMDFEQPKKQIVIICDNDVTGATWESLLASNDFEVTLSNEDYCEPKCEGPLPDLIIIDETVATLDGAGLIKRLREALPSMIFYLSAKNIESDIINAYEAGVDECYVKPIGPALFLCKVQALLRRFHSSAEAGVNQIKIPDWVLDTNRRVVKFHSGEEVKLSRLEFRFLSALMNRHGRVIETEQLIAEVWDLSGQGDQRLLKHLVYRLRKKIEEDPKNPKHIQTESGIGYKFV